MVVHDLDPMRPILAPEEDQPPLPIDPDGILTGAVAAQGFQPVAGRHAQIVQPLRRIQHRQLTARRLGQVRAMLRGRPPWKTSAVALSPKLRITPIRSASYAEHQA